MSDTLLGKRLIHSNGRKYGIISEVDRTCYAETDTPENPLIQIDHEDGQGKSMGTLNTLLQVWSFVEGE